MTNTPLNLETMKSTDVSKKIDPVEVKSLNKISLTGKVKTNLENNIKIKLDATTSKSVKDVVEAIKKANLSADEGQAIAGKDIKFTIDSKQYKILRGSEAAAIIQAYIKSTTKSSDILEGYKIDGKIGGTTLKAIETRKLQETGKVVDQTKKDVDKIKKDIENPLAKTRITDEVKEDLENGINAIDMLATAKDNPAYMKILNLGFKAGILDKDYLPEDMEIDAIKKTLTIGGTLKAGELGNRHYRASIDLNKIVNPLKTSEIDPDKFLIQLYLALKDLSTQNETKIENNKLNAIELRRKALRGQFDFATKNEPDNSSKANVGIIKIKDEITKLNAIIADFNKMYPANSITRDKVLKDKISAALNKDKADYQAALKKFELLKIYLKTQEDDYSKINLFKDGVTLSSEDFRDKYEDLSEAAIQNLKADAIAYQAIMKSPAHKKLYTDAGKIAQYYWYVNKIESIVKLYH